MTGCEVLPTDKSRQNVTKKIKQTKQTIRAARYCAFQ